MLARTSLWLGLVENSLFDESQKRIQYMERPQSSNDASNDFAEEKLGAMKSDASSRRERPVVLAK